MKMRILAVSILVAASLASSLWVGAQSNVSPRDQMIAYLDGIAKTHLDARAATIAQIKTRGDADRRKTAVRQKILQLIGGLPERRGAVAVKEFGSVSADGFRVDKIAYESLPNFWVTADLYIPSSGSGPFTAIVLPPGHGAGGKTENWSWGGNFARNGIVVLAYDPIGQGERLQYYDEAQKKSFIGNPTGEHGEANIPPMLIGDDIARYMVNDAMRGVDYLISRKDVDASRIGAFGCSGGGTMTAYFVALDDRVKAAATACYITSFNALLPSPTGAQDAEQSIPHFIAQGLDFADWVEAFAPKPYAVVSTQDDMFPFAGAKQTVEEAKQFYGVYGAADQVQWITGPGGHGNLGPISPAILTFFTKNLNASGGPAFAPLRTAQASDMTVTPTGQLVNSIGSETVYSLNRQRAKTMMTAEKTLANQNDLTKLQAQIRKDIQELTGTTISPGTGRTEVTIRATEMRDGYRIQTIAMKSDSSMELTGIVSIPDRSGMKPAILMMDTSAFDAVMAKHSDFTRLSSEGNVVMVLQPRPTPPGTESIKSPYLGPFNLLSMRAFLVGRSIIGMRIDDAIRAVDWLTTQKDIDRNAITIYGNGTLGMVALHAAALDTRISRVVLDKTLTSYRMIVEQPVHRNVSEVMIPGVLRRYDSGDLLEAVYPRPVIYVDPQNALGEAVPDDDFRKALAHVFRSDRNLGSANRIQLQSFAWFAQPSN